MVVVTVGTVGNTIDNYRSNFSTPIGRVVSLLKGIHPPPPSYWNRGSRSGGIWGPGVNHGLTPANN